MAAATAEAAASSAEEVTHLRNLLRSRTGELRAAEQDAADARADSDRLQAELAAVADDHSATVARLQARVAELERAGETVRREARTGRDVDDARLRLLLDTLTDAAAGVRRELALPAVDAASRRCGARRRCRRHDGRGESSSTGCSSCRRPT